MAVPRSTKTRRIVGRVGPGTACLLAALATALCLTSCGKPRKEGASAESASVSGVATESFLRLLQPRFVSAGDDPALPGPVAGRNAESAPRVEEGELIYPQPIWVSRRGKAQPTFVAWPDALPGFRIAEARFIHRTADHLTGKDSGGVRAELAEHDTATGRYYVPIERFFARSTEDADGALEHRLILDLRSDDGRWAQARLRFRIDTPPEVELRGEAVGAVPGRFGLTAAIHREGLEISRETVVNPTRRALMLWVRAEGGTQVENWLEQGFRCDFDGEHTRDWFRVRLRSGYRAVLGRLAVSRAGRGVTDTVNFEGGGWAAIPLAPGETVTLSWRIVPSGAVPVCAAAENRMMDMSCNGHSPSVHTATRVSGEVSRFLAVSGTDLRPEDIGAALSGHDSRLRSLIGETGRKIGVANGSAESGLPTRDFGCQGSFEANADGLG